MAEVFRSLDLSRTPTTVEQWKQGSREIMHAVSERVRKLLGRFETIEPTYRGADDYREILFPEQENEEGVMRLLRGKRVADIGSGLTHRVPHSLATQLTARWPESTYICVDPRFGYPVGHPKGFSPEARGSPLEAIAGSHAQLVAATGEHLPFADGSMDYYLSCYLMPWHFKSPEILLKFLSEMRRVLKMGGEARLGPLSKTHFDLLTKNNVLRRYLDEHFAVQVFPKKYSEQDQKQWVGFEYSLRLFRKA